MLDGLDGRSDRLPRMERIVDAGERRRQLRVVALQDIEHRGLLQELETELGVDLGGLVVGEEPMAVERARRRREGGAERRRAEGSSHGLSHLSRARDGALP